MKFNSQKLQEELRTKRIITEGLNVNAASRMAGVSKHQYTRAERTGGMDIDVFTKLVGWLGTNPSDYFTEINVSKGNPITKEMLLINGAIEVEDSLFYHLKIKDDAYIAISVDDHSFMIHGGLDEHQQGKFAAFDTYLEYVPQLEKLWFDLTGEQKQFTI